MKCRIVARVIACLLTALLLFSFIGCSGAAVRPSSNAKRVVATAGEIEITYDELYYLASTRIAELREEHGEDALEDPAVMAELESFVRENLLTRSHVLLAIAKEYGISPSKGDLAAKLDEDIQTIVDENFEGDRSAYIESLNEAHLTDRYVREYIAVEKYLAVEIIKVMLARDELDDSDETAREFIYGEELIRVNQVLIERRNYVSAEAARAKAEELRAKVAGVADPEGRAKEMRSAMQFSTYIDEGYGLYFARGEMDVAFEQTAFALEEFGVSEVCELDGDYYFLMRMPKEDAYMEQNFEALKQKTYFITLNGEVETRFNALTLEMTKYGEGLDLAELPEIDADGGEQIYKILLVVGGVATILILLFLIRLAANRSKAKKNRGGKSI